MANRYEAGRGCEVPASSRCRVRPRRDVLTMSNKNATVTFIDTDRFNAKELLASSYSCLAHDNRCKADLFTDPRCSLERAAIGGHTLFPQYSPNASSG
jgi:hypothetical protein